MFGYIYETVNLINGKKYIGQHKFRKFDTNYYGSGKLLKRAIEKYGKENFSTRLIEECTTQEELDNREIYWIDYYRQLLGEDQCYNIMAGGLTKRSWNKGKTGIYSEETLNKMREARRKRMSIKEERDRISKSLKGIPFTDERRHNISKGTKRAMQRLKERRDINE